MASNITISRSGAALSITSAPQSLLPAQSGLVVSPLQERAAAANTALETRQKALEIGEPIPIVFCRRVTIGGNDVGGVFVSPKASEGRFENNGTTNALTVNYVLVLSEGDMPQLQLRDVFQGPCRVGTWVQTYDQRAGTFTAGNFITAVAGTELWICPVYCGTSGTYDNLTTLAFQNTFSDGDQRWDRQVHCFVRQGMEITRILDSTLGSSNNVVDLALYLIRQTSRLPEDMLDLTAFTAAANFTNTNNLLYNGVFERSTNLEDWMQQIAKGFLLRVSDNNGKKGFRPALPVNANHTIKTTAITWEFGFTEEHLLPDGFSISYIPLADRKPICAVVLWREQPDDDIGIVRTTEIRIAGTATSGPYEQYDLSEFCTSENHAVKVGTFFVARRRYITHTLRIKVKPDAFNSTLELGDIVRVFLRRETDVETITHHDYLYEVERINKTISGAVELDLIHFPVDDQMRSLVALDVDAAVGVGYTLATGRSDYSCDAAGRRTDTTGLTDTGGNITLPASTNFIYEFTGGAVGPISGDIDNPADPFDTPTVPTIGGVPGDRSPLPGDELTVTNPCTGAYNVWYKVNTTTGEKTEIARDAAVYILQNSDLGYTIYVEGRCPDPGSPDGYGPPVNSEATIRIGEGGATWDPYPGAVSYRLRYIVGPGETLGDFATPPIVLGGQYSGDPCPTGRERPAYQNPTTGTFAVLPGKACYEDPTLTFALYALNSSGSIIATLTRKPI